MCLGYVKRAQAGPQRPLGATQQVPLAGLRGTVVGGWAGSGSTCSALLAAVLTSRRSSCSASSSPASSSGRWESMSMSGTEASTVIQEMRNMRFLLSSTVRYSRSWGTKRRMSNCELAVTMSCRHGAGGGTSIHCLQELCMASLHA